MELCISGSPTMPKLLFFLSFSLTLDIQEAIIDAF